MRMIDAHVAMRKIHEYMANFPNANTRRATCRVILSMLGDENQIPTLSPPNEPLTLEQLLEWPYKPVWITRIADLDVCDDGWAIPTCEIANKQPIMDLLDMQFELHIWWPGSEVPDVPKLENYGKTWLAYRYKPDGGGKQCD